ncbi:MAG TPA: inorganic diphosphatase [Saprospiraceae bacterium]|nr:inorganic diphosphatase [Saprospiraceae bacterium]HMQ83548.1 inorganic diphosphatase [Saprospiraceae bacterium]
MRFAFLFWILLGLFSCKQYNTNTAVKDYQQLPTFTENGIQVVVEIPAGTNHKIEYDKQSHQFLNDQVDGQDRVIDFLPYPGNYGFIPSTYMDPERGGDGDALDILVIGEAQPTGSVVEAIPIAVLLLKDEGEIDSKIIAIPADSTQQVIRAKDFTTFSIEFDGAKYIVENWFLYYKGLGVMEYLGWKDEHYAWEEIRKWAVKTAE